MGRGSERGGTWEKELIDHPSITAVAMVFHETSTSVINPVYEVGQLAKRYGKLYFVDAVSALGGEDVDVGAGQHGFLHLFVQ